VGAFPVGCTPTGIGNGDPGAGQLPTDFALRGCYPNPFNPSTAIEFQLAAKANVRVEIFDAIGRRVTTLINEPRHAGVHTVIWNGRNAYGNPVASGVYLFKLSAGDNSGTGKMVLLK
jgi:hypothetical protein